MVKFKATMIQCDINILQTSIDNGEYDFAKFDIAVQLQEPLPQATTFLMPADDFNKQVVYLPDGTKLDVLDFDPTTSLEVQEIGAALVADANLFVTDEASLSFELMQKMVSEMQQYWGLKKGTKKVEVPAGKTMFTFSYSRRVSKQPDGTFNLKTIVPLPAFELVEAAGTKASLTVNMPFGVSAENILKRQWTPINGVTSDLELLSLTGGRIFLNGYWQYDPSIDILYRY